MVVEVVNNVLTELSKSDAKNYISQIIFDAKHSNDDNIVFIAPNTYLSHFITTKYSAQIADVFERLCGKKPSIEIITNQQKKNSPKNESNNAAANKNTRALLFENFTFENFIVGDSNHNAFSMAKMAAEEPGQNYNPLFIYGSTGLGKTHLLHSIGNYTFAKGMNVICVTAEQFFNDFVVNLNNKTMQKFKEKYRNCDVLLIDDVQFLAKVTTDKVREEFFFTFNELKNKNSQIAMTSDEAPKNLKNFDERLISRFNSGLVVSITPPELETKIRIIKAKCEFDGVVLNEEIINYIATNMGDNIREIEGALLAINAYARLMSQEITLDFAKGIIKDLVKNTRSEINLEGIINVVASQMNIKVSEIKSKSKTKKIVEARRICIYLAKNLTPNSMPQLATAFGLKDHSAVSHNIKKINEIMQMDEDFKNQIEEIKNKILQEK